MTARDASCGCGALTAHVEGDPVRISVCHCRDCKRRTGHHFGPTCGVAVFYEIERRPGMISIPVGVFSDPDFPPPTIEVYVERRCPWLSRLAPQEQR